jgi:phosphatidylglycerol---prolipoprotein diacylglyceryl transferase
MKLDLHAGYSALVLLGIAMTLAFPLTRGLNAGQRRNYVHIQVLTLAGALLGAKFAVIVGDALWPLQPWPHWRSVAFSGRSIIGALLFGFITAELCKPWLHYDLPPNDRFAMALPFSFGVGRLGCLIAGCCAGVPWDGPGATIGIDGVRRFPSQLLEIGFQLSAGVLLLTLFRTKHMRGQLFACYMILYGIFRFISEFWRETAKAFGGYSAYQWMAIMLVLCGLWSWQRYRFRHGTEREETA